MTALRVAAVQMRSAMDPERNVADFERLVREAAGEGARYIQSPEMSGVLVRRREDLMARIRDADSDPLVAKAAALAGELGVHLHVGSTAVALPGGKVANRAFLFGPDGALITTYDKIHMFDVDLDNGESWRESATYAPGARTVVAELPFARLGMSVCYDLRFPQLFRAQAMAGAGVLTVPAAFTRQTGEAHWHALLRARAIENGAYVVAAAQGGKHEDGRETFGHSLVVDPWGAVVAEIDGDEPGVLVADIDMGRSAEARSKIPNLKNAREFAVDVVEAPDGAALEKGGLVIRFSLSCAKDHEFEAWFRDNADYDAQKKRKLVACPHCGSTQVDKMLMAPSIASGKGKAPMALAMSAEQRQAMAQLKALSEKVRQNADYVGDKFADEARKIHFGETDPRGIYGEATPEEAKGLAEDGVEFMPLPTFPDDRN